MERRKSVFLPIFSLLVVLAGWLGGAGTARADHNDNDFDVTGICYSCHVLNPLLADPDPNTSFIRVSTRTYDQMASLSGGATPNIFGCTFCHNDPTRSTYMKTAFGPFDNRPSQHPVDRNYSKDSYSNVTLGANTYTTLYMSNWDNTWIKPADQVDCVGCHEMAGSYPNHPRPDDVLRTSNPYMLRGGDSSWSAADDHASNSFCLQVCHSGAAQGTSGYRMGHYGWGAYDNTTGGMPDNTLKEVSGTALKTSKCVDCHETHSANAKPNLMGEQRQSNLNIDPADCTAACHNNADFAAAGHGKSGISLNCGNCHSASVTHRDSSNPKRFSSTESAAQASLALPSSYGSNGRDDDFDGVIDDAGEAALQLSAESICATTCHTDKHVHQGTIGATSGSASCLHCHDVHGHGVDNNVMMIRRTVMGSTTNYWTSGVDFYRSDNASVCDNPSCHAKPLGDTGTPGTIMGDVQEHKDVNAGPGTDCESCHNHSSTTGGSSFAPVCNSCHTYPGQPVLTGTHALGGAHGRHAGTDNTGGYAFSCSVCHNRYTHNQSAVNNASEWASKFQSSNVNLKFEGLWNPKNGNGPLYAGVAADNTLADNVYAPGVGGTGTCAGLYCHGDSTTVASWPAGTDTTPAWNDNASGACGTCHRATASVPPQTFAHARHADNTAAGYSISCRKCHYQTTSNGTTISSRSGHLSRESQVSFDPTDALVSSGSYSGTSSVGDSGSTAGTCANVYCHSPGTRTGAPFDNGALGAPDWKQGALSCNACHGASGQTGTRVGMPAYPNGSPKTNSHARHLDDGFTCRVCHWTTTTTDNTIADRSLHVNGLYDSANDNVANHAFTYSASTCSTAACHGGFASGPNMPVWGQGPYACGVCHGNTGGVAATADLDDFSYNSGVMSKIRSSEWTSTGHGRTSGQYSSGRNAANFPDCTTHCHTSSVPHDTAVNPFRLIDKAALPNTDFSDAADPQDDDKVCLDCHSAAGAAPSGSTLHVEANHFGLKHSGAGAQTRGGSFCWDCHDAHGDPNDSMIHDNVTKASDGQYGVPDNAAGSRMPTSFSKTNLNGESYDAVYDWGDYVDNSGPTPYTGVCQACHTDPAGTSGGTTGGAAYFSSTRFQSDHNKQAGIQGDRCTTCHRHSADFAPTCNTCHGDSTPEGVGGMPPNAPSAGNQVWSSAVDNLSNPAGVGNHRIAAGIDNSSHTNLDCRECHTDTPGSGSTHNVAGQLNATMTNIANHDWYNGAQAAWDNGGTAGATGSVVDDSCSNIDCHSPYYGAPANQYRSGTPMPYTRYWINQTVWDCYTCHAYDGRTATSRPGGADNTMATGMHAAHVGTAQMACSNCHDVTGYATTSFAGNHKSGFVDWSFTGAPNPHGTAPAYSVTSGSRAPTDDNTAAGHFSWGNCSDLYCHSTVQASPPSGGTGVTYATPAWDNAQTGQCGTCHAGDGVSGNLTLMATGSHSRHDNTAAYAIACTVCHTGAGTGTTAHANGAIQVPIGDSGWRVFTLAGASTQYTGAADNTNKAPGAAFGSCYGIACHSDGNGGPPRISPAIWGDTQAATTNCTYCHGGNASTGAAISSGSHTKHVLEKGFACGKCHAGTVSTGSDNTITGHANHVDGQKTVQFSAEVGGTFDNATKTCRNTYCHGTDWRESEEPFYYQNQPLPTWGVPSSVVSCAVCHVDQGAGANNPYSYRRMELHHPHSAAAYANDEPNYIRIACETCHAQRSENPGLHPNVNHAGGDDNPATERTAEVRFSDNAATQTYFGAQQFVARNMWTNPFTGGAVTPTYTEGAYVSGDNDAHNLVLTYTQGTCGTAWCHSNANPVGWKGTAGTNVYRTPMWSDSQGGACNYCHTDPMREVWGGTPRDMTLCDHCHRGAAAAAAMAGTDNLSNAHIAHVATDRYAFTCDECHAWTVRNDNTTSLVPGTGHDNHVNGTKTVRFGTTLRTTAIDQSGGAYNNGAYTCANLYCHSNGTDNVTFGAPLDNTISWSSATGGTCTTCHGNTAAALTSNAHPRHLQSGFACGACHYDTAVDNATLRAGTGYASHVNGFKNVVIDNTYDNTPGNKTDDWAGGSCSNVKCHGGAPVAWNAASLSCEACHTKENNVDVTFDVDDFAYNSGTMSKINPSDYAARGHGAAVNLPWTGGTNPGGKVCLDCHSNASAALHDNGANPFRFRGTINSQAVAFDNVNTVCLACHSSAALQEHSKAVTGGGSSGWDHGQKCLDCHDVHGEGNIFMVHDNIVWQTNGGATYATSDDYGIPYFPGSRASVSFTNNASGSDYASTTLDGNYTNGICETCHTRTAQYARSGNQGPGSHSTDTCTTCHEHDGGFKGSGCSGCHGASAAGRYWPDSSPSAAYPDRAGAHDNHVAALSQYLYTLDLSGLLADPATDNKQKAICAFCHKNPGEGGHTLNGGGDSSADVYDSSGAGNYFRKFTGGGAYDNDVTGGAYDNVNKSCSNLVCHNQVATPSGASDWNAPPAPNCTTLCHPPSAQGQRHDLHTVSPRTYACTECHTDHGSGYGHITGVVDFAWNNAGSFERTFGDNSVTYSGTSGYKDGSWGTCASAACHNNKTTPSWSSSATSPNCSVCHADDGSNALALVDPASGLHRYNAAYPEVEGHDNTFGPGGAYTCTSCHNAPPTDNHVNGTVNTPATAAFSFDNTGKTILLWALADNGDDTCAASCHADANNWYRQWSAAAYSDNTTPGNTRCGVCHGQLNDWRGGLTVNHDRAKVNDGTHATCATCHVMPDPPYDWGTHHDNASLRRIQVNGNPDLAYDNTDGTCSSACHDRTKVMGTSSIFAHDNSLVGSGVSCSLCHGGGLSGEGLQNWWPDSQAQNGTAWPNRNGGASPHNLHVTRIAEVVNATATPTTVQKNATCDFCHPTGQHTGDQAAAPADLMDGITYVFKNIAGAANLRTTTVTQGPGADNTWNDPAPSDDAVTCSNVDCHYTRPMGAADWYSPTYQSTCSYCHVPDNASYVAGDLPNAHDKHVGDYDYICGWCHPTWGGTFDHQDGQVSLAWSYNPGPEAGDRSVAGGTGVPKFGGGAAGDYATCGGLTCHGDWDDGGIGFKGGNNYSPVWFNTAAQVGTDNSDGRCGTCHGDVAGVTDTDKAWPRSGVNSESHGEHIASNASPTCSACHYDASGTNGTYGNPATHANRALTPIDIDNTYNYEAATAAFEGTGNTCSNVRCHNGATAPNFTLSGGTNIACGMCHNGGEGATDPRPSGDNVSRSHPAHADNNAVYTDCDKCHGDATYNVSGSRGGSAYTATGGGGGLHQDLSVEVWINGAANRYVDTADTAGGVNWNSAGATHVDDGTCSTTVCHGAGVPTWGGTLPDGCGSCHGGPGIPWPAVGAHNGHFAGFGIVSLTDAEAPAKCDICHTGYGSGTAYHADNNYYQVSIAATYQDKSGGSMTYAPTTDNGACSNVSCHGGLATPGWQQVIDAATECALCHLRENVPDRASATEHNSAISGMHAITTTVSGKDHPGDLGCTTECHSGQPTLHFAGLDNAALDPVDNLAVGVTASSCAVSCHSDGGKWSRLNDRAKASAVLDNAVVCATCHGTFSQGFVAGVVPVHDNNWDGDGNPSEVPGNHSVCKTCHGMNSSTDAHANYTVGTLWNPSGTASMHGDGQVTMNGPPAVTTSAGYDNTNWGCNSAGCHGDASTGHHLADSGWPVGYGDFGKGNCNDCHSYPGLGGSTYWRTMSAVHAEHVGTPASTAGSKEYACEVCHFGYSPDYHNQTGVGSGQDWSANDPTWYLNVNVRFDDTLNPPVGANDPSYAGAKATGQSAPGTSGANGTCAGLYCHGNNANLNVNWGGVDTQPKWDNSIAITCGDCHKTDSNFAQGNHPAHLAATYGPVLGSTCSGLNSGCHTDYGLSSASPHANGQATFRTSPSDGTATDNAGTQVCNNCHTTYTNPPNVPTSGVALGKAQWDNTTDKLPCVTCHNGGADTQASANIDSTGGRAHSIEGTYYASGHGASGIDNASTSSQPPIACTACHDASLGHIGANRPSGANPWRLLASTNFNLSGGLDNNCASACHSGTTPANHTYRVTGFGETEEGPDTHPTSTAAVDTGKDRWFLVPDNVHVPLQGNLTEESHTKTATENIVCVSCHDPHGVGTAAIPSAVRSFSGQNSDGNGNKMLRFDYSSGQPTALCSVCHQ